MAQQPELGFFQSIGQNTASPVLHNRSIDSEHIFSFIGAEGNGCLLAAFPGDWGPRLDTPNGDIRGVRKWTSWSTLPTEHGKVWHIGEHLPKSVVVYMGHQVSELGLV